MKICGFARSLFLNQQEFLRRYCPGWGSFLMFNSVFAKKIAAFLELRTIKLSQRSFADDKHTLTALDQYLAEHDYRQRYLSEEILGTWIRPQQQGKRQSCRRNS
jgi:hypothetical protein